MALISISYLKSVSNPLSGTLNSLLHNGHLILDELFMTTPFKQPLQNVWLHGRTFGSLNISKHIEHLISSSNWFLDNSI